MENKAFNNSVRSGILTSHKFEEITELNSKLQDALAENGYVYLTPIQYHVIPKMLQGRDVLGAAQTGSGKTLAFVIPAVDLLYSVKAKQAQGTLVLIIAPTRELVSQTMTVATNLTRNVTHTVGCIYGGSNRKEEERQLTKGINLLICTPGRLLDHLQNSSNFIYQNLAMLILDEADRILEIGFEKELTKILKILPSERQTALFSATKTAKMIDIVKLSLNNPVLIEVKQEQKTVEGLEQFHIICPPGEKLALLYKILKDMSKEASASEKSTLKIMVFLSTCQSTQYHENIFRLFNNFIPILGLHGQKKQNKRLEIYHKFSNSKKSILFCTNVAARGLDFPNVDVIIQYDPPDDIREYIHRVGRTARGTNSSGSSILFLLPQEIGLLKLLAQENIVTTAMDINYRSLEKIQSQLEKIIQSTPELQKDAITAFKKFLLAYHSHSLKNIFQIEKLDIGKLAKSFALSTIPKYDLPALAKIKRKTQKNTH
uniref:ATP-dependent RNA helicase n=1 Tax=Dermatophagoides pteronyssinus TaxID=6956 RepID=A0A6P6Y9L1_DERPT|nr:ATP-dependent RNA helicase has1-like [Dermatophagoides pteronyssinus]